MEWATRGQRFLARIIDGVVYIGIALGAIYVVAPLVGGGALILVIAGVAFFGIVQVVLLSMRGQHLGKWMLGLEIVRIDGSPAGFLHAFLVRDGVTILIGLIPGIGAIYRLINDLFIFSRDELCLHDHIAGTRVIRIPSRTSI